MYGGAGVAHTPIHAPLHSSRVVFSVNSYMVINLDHKVNDIGSGPGSHSLQEEDRGEGRWRKK